MLQDYIFACLVSGLQGRAIATRDVAASLLRVEVRTCRNTRHRPPQAPDISSRSSSILPRCTSSCTPPLTSSSNDTRQPKDGFEGRVTSDGHISHFFIQLRFPWPRRPAVICRRDRILSGPERRGCTLSLAPNLSLLPALPP